MIVTTNTMNLVIYKNHGSLIMIVRANKLIKLHHKISYPFSNLFLILFSIISAIGLKSSNVSYGVGLSLLIIVIYYVLIVIGKNLGVEGAVNPLVSAWIPNITILSMAIYYYKRYVF